MSESGYRCMPLSPAACIIYCGLTHQKMARIAETPKFDLYQGIDPLKHKFTLMPIVFLFLPLSLRCRFDKLFYVKQLNVQNLWKKVLVILSCISLILS